ncbi:MAG: energy transducer TonB [Sediminibacterium sp.]|nr:energy transducer TonB [Sediminibacterium sp.]
MQTTFNQQADWLDVLFQHRNKLYGAYELRRNYPRRLTYSLLGLLAICLLLITVASLATRKNGATPAVAYTDFVIDPYKPDPVTPPPPPPPPVQTQVRQEMYVVPLIVQDNLVNPDEVLPPVENLQLANIGTARIDGIDGTGNGWEDPAAGNAVPVNPPHQDAPEETQFASVQIPAAFPGGVDAWSRYLQRNLNQEIPMQEGAPAGRYTVIVAFTVSAGGVISDVVAETDPGFGTAAEAIRVIKKGPNWTPANQNGRMVPCRHKQQITFVVSAE